MKIKMGEYLIESDSRQFIVKERKVVQEGEKKGEEYFTNAAYCCKFEQALSFLPQQVLRTNDDVNIIMNKLNQIKADIEQITEYPVIEVKAEKENVENE